MFEYTIHNPGFAPGISSFKNTYRCVHQAFGDDDRNAFRGHVFERIGIRIINNGEYLSDQVNSLSKFAALSYLSFGSRIRNLDRAASHGVVLVVFRENGGPEFFTGPASDWILYELPSCVSIKVII